MNTETQCVVTNQKGTTRWLKGLLVWAAASLFVLFQFFLQLSSGEMVDGLMSSFHVAAFGASILASTYYYVYVTLQTPSGLLIDRFGPRLLLSIGAVICAIGTFIFADAHYIMIAGLGRLLMGMGAACAFVGSLNLIARWFPAKHFALMAAIAETIGMIGSIVGGSILANLLRHYGWRDCMFGSAAILLVLALIIVLVVRNEPPDAPFRCPKVYRGRFFKNMLALAKNKYAWINGIYSGLAFSVVTAFVALWAIPFLMEEHGLSLFKSTIEANMVFLGVAVASPVMGWLDSRIRCRRCLLSVSAMISAVLAIFIIYVPSLSLGTLTFLLILLGMSSSTYVLAFAVANEIVPDYLRGTSMGFTNTLCVGMAPILQPLIGLFLSLMVGHAIKHHGLSNYTLMDYQVALALVPFALATAAVLAWFIPVRLDKK